MKLFRFFVFLIGFLIVIVVLMTVFVHPFLSVNKPIASKNLVIDAWRSGYELETIIEQSKPYKLEKVFVVGKKIDNETESRNRLSDFEKTEYFRWKEKEGVLLLTNSTLLVDISKLSPPQFDTIQTIVIKASDTRKNNTYAHFCLALNGKLLGSSFVNDSVKEYLFKTNTKPKENLLLAICFDNDHYTRKEDRNLYIESILINGISYKLDETNSIITRYRSLLTTGFNSEAAQASTYLKALNVDPGIIEIVEFEINGVNHTHTLTAALKLKEHLKYKMPKDINVSSAGLHARRTLFTYKNVLDLDQVGIFNVQVKMSDKNNWYKSFPGIYRMLDEFASYIYVWFYLNFS